MMSTKCPNCGATMILQNSQLTCPACRTTILQIIDAKIDSDVTVMSAEEFSNFLKKSKTSFVIHIKDDLKVFDVDTAVINKKIKDAADLLAKGHFSDVINRLSGLSTDILSVERLRFLARYQVKSEQELAICDDIICGSAYQNILRLADQKTAETYRMLAEHCARRVAIIEEINQGLKLTDNQLWDEAITYANKMCQSYPTFALSWVMLAKAKIGKNPRYGCNQEYSMMCACPDFEKFKFGKFANVKEKLRIRFGHGESYWKYVGGAIGAMLMRLGWLLLFLFTGLGIILAIVIPQALIALGIGFVLVGIFQIIQINIRFARGKYLRSLNPFLS